MDARNNIATDLFYKIRSRFSGLKLGEETGAITIMPEKARFFDFDYMEQQKAIGHVSISLAEPNSMKVYFSHGITEGMDDGQKDNWYGFLKELRQFAKRRLLSFDTRDIAKDNLDQRDYEFLSQNAQPKQPDKDMIQKPVGESVMNESTMYGSRLMSYQNLLDTRLIIKHNQAVMDDTQPGARTRHISALFVENQDGERFKYPFIHLAGARAMQRHVANGGVPYDDVGKSIVKMSEEIAQLKSFSNYVVRNDLMNSETNGIVERSGEALNRLREQIKAISKQSHYEAYRENFQAQDQLEVPQEIAEEFKEKFTVKNFKEDIANVFPVLYRLMKEGNTIGYDDIVAMTQEELQNEDVEIDTTESDDPFAKFEQWVMGLGENSAVTSEDPEEQQAAIKELQSLVGEHFPAGTDGTNAIESLKGIIEDPELYKQIKEQAKSDPDGCVRPLIKDWLEQNAPEIIDQLDFGDMVDAPAAAQGGDQTAPEGEPQMADFQQEGGVDPNRHPQSKDYGTGDDEDDLPFEPDPEGKPPSAKAGKYGIGPSTAKHLAKQGMKPFMEVKELAEFINSFYDRDTGTFPKGPEGVVVMVGKKFGEQAEQVARKFVERMAPHQEQGAEQMQELSRMRELAGIPQQSVEEGPSYSSATDKLSDIAAKALVKYQIEPFDHSDFRSSDDKTITDAIEEMDDKVLSAKVLKAIDRLETREYLKFIDDTFVKAHRLANALIYPEKKTELDKFQREGVEEGSDERVKFRGTDHDIGEERYRFVINGDTIFFNFPSDEDNPDPDSPSFEEILAKVQRSSEVRHYRITPEEQMLIAKKIAAERQRYLDQRQQEEGVSEESSGYYYERLAQEVFDENPNLDTSGRADDLLNAAFPLIVRDLGSKKRANNLLNYDEDFASDFVSAYGELKRNSGSNESSTVELENIKRLSGIAQGLGY